MFAKATVRPYSNKQWYHFFSTKISIGLKVDTLTMLANVTVRPYGN